MATIRTQFKLILISRSTTFHATRKDEDRSERRLLSLQVKNSKLTCLQWIQTLRFCGFGMSLSYLAFNLFIVSIR